MAQRATRRVRGPGKYCLFKYYFMGCLMEATHVWPKMRMPTFVFHNEPLRMLMRRLRRMRIIFAFQIFHQMTNLD